MSREQIALVLKRLRTNTDLTADEVGKMVGKSGKTVNAWENNRGQPDAEILIKLCDIYNVSDILSEFKGAKITANYSAENQTERQLLDDFRKLNDEGQEKASSLISDLVATGRYKKDSEYQLDSQKAE